MKTQRATGRIFIVHSSKDMELVRDMERRLRAVGLEPMGVMEHVSAVAPRKKVLLDRIRKADAVLALITPSALDSSWTVTELGMADGFDKPVLLVIAGPVPRLEGPLATYQSVPFDQLDGAISELSQRLADSSGKGGSSS